PSCLGTRSGTRYRYHVPDRVSNIKVFPTHARLDVMTVSAPRGRPARSSPRRRNVDTARLQELLAQASDIVLAEGFTSITMDQLAQRLGCSKATLYSLAGTKDQLVQTIPRHFFS